MPAALLRLLIGLGGWQGGSTLLKALLGKLAGGPAAKLGGGALGRTLGRKGVQTGLNLGGGLGGMLGAEALADKFIFPPEAPQEDLSDDVNFSRLIDQMGTPPPPNENVQNLMELLQREDQYSEEIL